MVKDESAVAWLSGKAPYQWTRSHFNYNSKCDILLNNMCKTFNKAILFVRDKPILVILEMIRNFLMRILQGKR